MNTDIKRTSEASLREISSYAYREIEKYKPDCVVIFGDIAFRYVSPAIAKDKIPIVFSGLLNYDNIIKDIKLPTKIGGVKEYYDLTKLCKFISSSYASLWKIFILYDTSVESRLILHNILSELRKCGITDTESIEIVSYNELTKRVLNLNKRSRAIIFSCLTKITTTENNLVGEEDILRYIRKINVEHLELSSYTYANTPEIGFAVGVGPDFHSMGTDAGKLIMDFEKGSDLRIETERTILSINTRRISELGLSEIYKKSNKLFESIYSYYE